MGAGHVMSVRVAGGGLVGERVREGRAFDIGNDHVLENSGVFPDLLHPLANRIEFRLKGFETQAHSVASRLPVHFDVGPCSYRLRIFLVCVSVRAAAT